MQLSVDNQQSAITVCNPMRCNLHPLVQALFSTKQPTPTSTSNKRSHIQMDRDITVGKAGRMIQNPKPEPTFKLKLGINYCKVFTADTICSGVSKLHWEQICCRCQVLSRCYEKCPRAASHMTLKDNVQSKFSQFFAKATAN